jgi:hypothetical protein
MLRQDETTKPGGACVAVDCWWEIVMAIAMDELDLAFLAPTDRPLWQPLGGEHVFQLESGSRLTGADSGWSAIAQELEQDLVWAEVVAMLEVSEATKLLRS